MSSVSPRVAAGASGAEVRPGVPPGHEPHEGKAGVLGASDLEAWRCGCVEVEVQMCEVCA